MRYSFLTEYLYRFKVRNLARLIKINFQLFVRSFLRLKRQHFIASIQKIGYHILEFVNVLSVFIFGKNANQHIWLIYNGL